MTTDQSPTVIEYVADADTARRLADAWLRIRLRSRAYVIMIGAVVLFFVGYTVLTRPIPSLIPAEVAIFIAIFAFGYFRMRSATRRSFRRLFPAGAKYSVGVGDTALVLWGPTSRSTVEYSTYRDVTVSGSIVALRLRASSIATVLPRELLPGDAAELVRARVEAAQPRS